jgi:HAMP domain-containing protein
LSESLPSSPRRVPDDKPKRVKKQASTEEVTRPAVAVAHGRQPLSSSALFFLAMLACIGAVVAVAVGITTWQTNTVSDQALGAEMQRLPESFVGYKREIETRLLATTRALAEQPGTKALFASEVADATRADWARDMRRTLEASTIFLFGSQATLLARAGAGTGTTGDDFREVGWVAGPLSSGDPAAATIREDYRPAIVAAVPIRTTELAHVDGVLATAYAIDGDRLLAMQSATRSAIGFVYDADAAAAVPRAKVTIASRDFAGDDLVEQLVDQPAFVQLLRRGGVFGPADVHTKVGDLIVVGVPVRSASGTMLGAFLLTRSRDAEGAAFRAIRRVIVWSGVVAIAIALPLAWALGRSISRPVEKLARAAVTLRDGGLDLELPQGGAEEVQALSRAFASLVVELRQKQELERMLASVTKPDAPSGPDPIHVTDRYEVFERLGHGGRGTVMRAYDRQLEEYVALKLLTPKTEGASEESIVSFKRELRIGRKISHVNVVRMHDIGEWQNQMFISMELLAGTTLADLLRVHAPFGYGPGLQIVKQICRGLAAIHDTGIVHRDLKPQNVMVLSSGVVKIMDFGISRQLDTQAGKATSSAGTPVYMSPEQFTGDALDVRSDVYAMGILLYEVFTGSPPFRASTLEEIRNLHMTATPMSPSKKRPDIPERLERLIMMALSKRRSHRPGSIRDVYAALQRVSSDLEEEA